MWLLYQLLLGLLLLVSAPVFLLVRGRHYLPTLPGRLGRAGGAAGDSEQRSTQAPPTEPPLWIHAVSVGEVAVAATLVGALPDSLPLLVTTVTPTGQDRARSAFGHRPATTVAYLPFDLAPTLLPFLDRHRPRALVLVEGEMWPYLLEVADRRGLPVIVVNTRISDRSFARLRRLRGLLAPLLGALLDPILRFGVQSEQDAQRLSALGVAEERIVRTGNLKFDSPEPVRNRPLEETLRRVARGRTLIIAGSTMKGEEPCVLEAVERLGSERALLVLAPRHPERFDAVWQLILDRRLQAIRRSEIEPVDRPTTEPVVDVVLLDTLGELAGLYACADAAFIGGTLVATGGHNPLEAARFAVPVVVGPSMENFREMAELFDEHEAWCRVANSEELARCLGNWLDHPREGRIVGQRAGDLVQGNRGALEKTLALLTPLVAGSHVGAAGQEDNPIEAPP